MTSCRDTNESRVENQELWDHVLTLITTPRTSAAGQREVDALRAYVAQIYKPHDCANL